MLFKALSCFALRDIDLTKIERCARAGRAAGALALTRVVPPVNSRPMRSNPITVVDPEAETSGSGRILRFGYLFYADLAASTADSNTQNALRHLQVCAVVSVRSSSLLSDASDGADAQEMAPFMRVLGCYPMDNSGRYAPAATK